MNLPDRIVRTTSWTIRIHAEGKVEQDIRAFGMNKETGGIARQFVLEPDLKLIE